MGSHDPRHIQARFQAAKPGQDTVRPARILFVDDQAVMRELIAEHLRLQGYEVVEASNAFQALTILSSGDIFDLVITDIDLPGDFGGLELARMVKEAVPATRVIALSGSARLPGRADAIDRFVGKPATSRQIRRQVDEILRPAPLHPGTKGQFHLGVPR
jgi:CheY-like chemotaxis protein